MTTIKHPATLIHNGVVIAMAISFAAALGMIEQLTGLSFQRGAARARVNFYKGREYYRAVGNDYFAIVPTDPNTHQYRHADNGTVHTRTLEDAIEHANLPHALATYLAAAVHTGDVLRIRELIAAHSDLTSGLYLMKVIAYERLPLATAPFYAWTDRAPEGVYAMANWRKFKADIARTMAESLSKVRIPFKMIDKPAPAAEPAPAPAPVTRAPSDVVIKKVGNSWAIMF